MEELRRRMFPKRNWFVGWFIGNTFYRATTQREAEIYQLDYELTLLYGNMSDTDSDTASETDDEG
jgi:hypothetical protein